MGLVANIRRRFERRRPKLGAAEPDYRRAGPEDLVVEGDLAMMGPAGTPVGEPRVAEMDPEALREEPSEGGALEAPPRSDSPKRAS